MARGGQRSRMLAREQEATRLASALSFAEAREGYREGALPGPELAAVYIAERVHHAAGTRWLQAERRDRPVGAPPTTPWLRLIAERELCRIPPPVPRALIGWAEGQRDVELLFEVPSARRVLALQARGRRCLSLLAEGVPTAPHEDGLAFAVHDLCHLEKFADRAFHEEQVGFFSLLDRALADPRWEALEAPLDPLWVSERDHVLADMNGSAIFLFLVLKNKLKLAIRRTIARTRGTPIPVGGPLDPEEAEACAEAQRRLMDLLDLAEIERESASALTTRSDGPWTLPLLARFRAEGARALRTKPGTQREGDEDRASNPDEAV